MGEWRNPERKVARTEEPASKGKENMAHHAAVMEDATSNGEDGIPEETRNLSSKPGEIR